MTFHKWGPSSRAATRPERQRCRAWHARPPLEMCSPPDVNFKGHCARRCAPLRTPRCCCQRRSFFRFGGFSCRHHAHDHFSPDCGAASRAVRHFSALELNIRTPEVGRPPPRLSHSASLLLNCSSVQHVFVRLKI